MMLGAYDEPYDGTVNAQPTPDKDTDELYAMFQKDVCGVAIGQTKIICSADWYFKMREDSSVGSALKEDAQRFVRERGKKGEEPNAIFAGAWGIPIIVDRDFPFESEEGGKPCRVEAIFVTMMPPEWNEPLPKVQSIVRFVTMLPDGTEDHIRNKGRAGESGEDLAGEAGEH
jgi:hypothetical protein